MACKKFTIKRGDLDLMVSFCMMIDAVIPGSKTMYEEQNEDDESKKMQLLLPQLTPAHQMKLTAVAMQQTDEPWNQQGKRVKMTDLDVSVITDKNYHLFWTGICK